MNYGALNVLRDQMASTLQLAYVGAGDAIVICATEGAILGEYSSAF